MRDTFLRADGGTHRPDAKPVLKPDIALCTCDATWPDEVRKSLQQNCPVHRQSCLCSQAQNAEQLEVVCRHCPVHSWMAPPPTPTSTDIATL